MRFWWHFFKKFFGSKKKFEIKTNMSFDVGSADAKKHFWLRPEDLRTLEKHTEYFGFAQGRASWYFRESDLLAAAIAKHGKEGYEKKVASRTKREAKKRAREDHAAAAAASSSSSSSSSAMPPAAKKQKVVKDYTDINDAMLGAWNLILTKPDQVKETVGSITMSSEYDGNISVDDLHSLAYTFGNLHGLATGSSWSDRTVKFDTKWKVCGKRWSGTLSLTMEKNGTTLKGKYNSGVSKSLGGIKVIEFTGEKVVGGAMGLLMQQAQKHIDMEKKESP